jgi:hypothetical protein
MTAQTDTASLASQPEQDASMTPKKKIEKKETGQKTKGSHMKGRG